MSFSHFTQKRINRDFKWSSNSQCFYSVLTGGLCVNVIMSFFFNLVKYFLIDNFNVHFIYLDNIYQMERWIPIALLNCVLPIRHHCETCLIAVSRSTYIRAIKATQTPGFCTGLTTWEHLYTIFCQFLNSFSQFISRCYRKAHGE